MSVAKITEISATSDQGFDDAVKKGIERASKTLKNICGAWVKEQHVEVQDGKVTDKGIAELKLRMPHADISPLEEDPDVNKVGEVFTVDAVVKFVMAKLD